ncbi:MAG: hypothetical protein IPF62_01960 [Bacteroidetes bacterium]|nr:hypothetical protein [Bacteroidota bacterium]
MSAKKKYADFSTSYVANAAEAGIDSTYIPEEWKIFFRASIAVRLRSGRRVGSSGVVSKKANSAKALKKAAPKKVARKIAKKAKR